MLYTVSSSVTLCTPVQCIEQNSSTQMQPVWVCIFQSKQPSDTHGSVTSENSWLAFQFPFQQPSSCKTQNSTTLNLYRLRNFKKSESRTMKNIWISCQPPFSRPSSPLPTAASLQSHETGTTAIEYHLSWDQSCNRYQVKWPKLHWTGCQTVFPASDTVLIDSNMTVLLTSTSFLPHSRLRRLRCATIS